MSILIQGPRQPGNNIDVFLQPLLEELLQLWRKGERVPVASWSLQTKEKERLLQLFHELKVPTGYSSNIRRIANMKDMKFNMSCLKAHNCHVIMTQLLPVAIKGVLSVKVRG
jgi:hypothetical protein